MSKEKTETTKDIQMVLDQVKFPDVIDIMHISTSANEVYSFISKGRKYVLKYPALDENALSPAWEQLQMIFQSSYSTQASAAPFLTSYLRQNPHINVPQVIHEYSKQKQFQIIEFVEGISYEPDKFPPAVSYQLGRYVGWHHSKIYNGYGIYSKDINLHDSSTFVDNCINSMRYCIDKYWTQDSEVTAFYDKIINSPPEMPKDFVLMMLDISGNQFIYSSDLKKIVGVVDFDAYVIGPKELELSLVELVIDDCTAFIEGYEEYQVMPTIEPVRDFYRFMVYLNEPWCPTNLAKFINTYHLFE